ncbi:unnamed protein product, partial [Allacma fusca]
MIALEEEPEVMIALEEVETTIDLAVETAEVVEEEEEE